MLIVTKTSGIDLNKHVNNFFQTIINSMQIDSYSEKELAVYLPLETKYLPDRKLYEDLKTVISEEKETDIRDLDYCLQYMLYMITDTYCRIFGDTEFKFPLDGEVEKKYADHKSEEIERIIKIYHRKWATAWGIRHTVFDRLPNMPEITD